MSYVQGWWLMGEFSIKSENDLYSRIKQIYPKNTINEQGSCLWEFEGNRVFSLLFSRPRLRFIRRSRADGDDLYIANRKRSLWTPTLELRIHPKRQNHYTTSQDNAHPLHTKETDTRTTTSHHTTQLNRTIVWTHATTPQPGSTNLAGVLKITWGSGSGEERKRQWVNNTITLHNPPTQGCSCGVKGKPQLEMSK